MKTLLLTTIALTFTTTISAKEPTNLNQIQDSIFEATVQVKNLSSNEMKQTQGAGGKTCWANSLGEEECVTW